MLDILASTKDKTAAEVAGTAINPWLRKKALSSAVSSRKKQGKVQRALPASQLLSAMLPVEAVQALVSITTSVSWSIEGKPLKFETLRHQQSTFPRNSSVTQIRQTSGRVRNEAKKRLAKMIRIMYITPGASHIWQRNYVNLICPDEEANTVQPCFFTTQKKK